MKISKSEITKKSLINSALNVLCKTSYKGAKLQDVANEVGLSRGAIYWNFKNKFDLYDQVLKESFDTGMHDIYAILDSNEPVVNTIKKVINYLLDDRFNINYKSALLYNGLVIEHPEEMQPIITRVDKLFNELFKRHNALLKRGIQTGELKSDINTELEARVMYNFIWGYYTNKIRFFSKQNRMEIKDYVYKKFVLQLAT
ncbi:transcriptional regulator, TetR family [Mariniphaga anaerophila]|uniref:Transcriptional regulator, TetR family n=1 Tax=Mariniphaga anaerophila TaxID=1484053 RepID=A0A1M4VRY4_9BACT|nr:TetR/AcrR family transcriptional regulator [Mariniphaga anaerophila]SHE71607.1 transcriptional regulator, TetR family [Mariniphaga anaerophila]